LGTPGSHTAFILLHKCLGCNPLPPFIRNVTPEATHLVLELSNLALCS
jgi:hypothetical protein